MNTPPRSVRNQLATLLAVLGLSAWGAAQAQEAASAAPAETKPVRSLSFFDPEDGMLDASDFLLNHKGALPVPIVITEPAVGYGFGLGLAFFSESMAEAAASARASGKGPAPPNITVVGGAYTEFPHLGWRPLPVSWRDCEGGCPAGLLWPTEPGARLRVAGQLPGTAVPGAHR